ncbi:MAG: hypothetical protein E6R03_14840 [Hyphomicrobiaceae bacterium]|nr:MAG: hypothetical protein E6R03_14840 [Hyphomicrobiaceae bacterium]
MKEPSTLSAAERMAELLASLTPEKIAADKIKFAAKRLEDAVQAHIEATAKANGYDGEASLASYVASANSEWAQDAAVFVQWRDAVWTAAQVGIDQVKSGQAEIADIDAFIASLPKIVWRP